MELRHLRYFVAIAEEKSFTRAAARVGIGQPPLSQQIKDLEGEIGARLFRRLPHGVELSEAGEAFYPQARALLMKARDAVGAARGAARGETGELRIGYTSSALFHPRVARLVRAYRAAYPGVDLSLYEAPTSTLLGDLERGQLDAAFLRPGPLDPAGCPVMLVDDERFAVALPVDSALAGKECVSLGELSQQRFILFPRQAGPGFFDEIMAACRRAGFQPGAIQEAPQIASVANLVAAGMGIALVPACLACIQAEGVTYRPLDDEVLRARLVLAVAPGEEKATARRLGELLD